MMVRLAKSKVAFEQACRVLVGGVNSPVRAFGAVGGTPPVIAFGEGAKITDIDGNTYIDYVCGYGPLILGHAQEQVVTAITKAATRGSGFGAPTEDQTQLAEVLLTAYPQAQRVRLMNSGTEACMTAIRLARAATGRNKIIKCAGAYHGHADSMLVQAGSGALTLGVPSSPGVPAATAATTIVVPFNDIDAVRKALEADKDVAAMIVEPVCGNIGTVPPQKGYLQALARACHAHGALLIFDEVMTGFRLAFGGAQEVYDVLADLTALAKIIGGGLPLAAVVGPAATMDLLAPAGPVYQAGTHSGNPLAVAAGLATLAPLRTSAAYGRLEGLGADLAAGLRQAAAKAGLVAADRVCIQRAGSMLTVFFTAGPVTNYQAARTCDTRAYAAFFHAMLEAGVNLPPSQFESWFISLAHSDGDIRHTLDAAADAFSSAAARLT